MDPSTNSLSIILLVNMYYTPTTFMLWASTQTMLLNDVDLSVLRGIKYKSEDIH